VQHYIYIGFLKRPRVYLIIHTHASEVCFRNIIQYVKLSKGDYPSMIRQVET